MPEGLDPSVFTLTTSDGARLSAVELGSDDRGVLLSHEQGCHMCSRLAFGQHLEIVAGGLHGTDVLREDDPEELWKLIRGFVDSAFRR
ncbi:hypothetical protein [Lentzea sp. NBRC 102530]|uniref:hypothetical protein n=1 Tax=Lentzea sp. NBRC 102530 TaxID=3032201 RepID=UPI0025555759|nr:hypothetical protein [Lentzea sp. NBRC 102530]